MLRTPQTAQFHAGEPGLKVTAHMGLRTAMHAWLPQRTGA